MSAGILLRIKSMYQYIAVKGNKRFNMQTMDWSFRVIGHFGVALCLIFKTSPRAKPFK